MRFEMPLAYSPPRPLEPALQLPPELREEFGTSLEHFESPLKASKRPPKLRCTASFVLGSSTSCTTMH